MSGPRRFAALLVAVFAGLAAVLVGASSSVAAPAYRHHPHISCNPRANEHSHVFCDGDGYLKNDTVHVTIHSKTYALGTVHTNAAGAFTNFRVLLPAGVVGTHTITGTGRGGKKTDSASTLILIIAPGGSGTGGVGTGGSGGGTSFTGVAVAGLGVIGLGLLGTGGLLVLSGRRRRRALA